ncbi:unnamed protein product [Meloidogyne enterolobii]|uniref:Uncharacterized protein n=1 Tax=Meloidogyne enterolobii TaxID=390850 RepID=A0ACB0XWZ0_MELEN
MNEVKQKTGIFINFFCFYLENSQKPCNIYKLSPTPSLDDTLADEVLLSI